MIYNDESRQQYPVFAGLSDDVWNRVFKGKEVSDFINENIVEMLEEKKCIGWFFMVASFAKQDIWWAIGDYHQLSSQERYKLAEDFSVPDYWQEYIAIMAGDLDYLNTFFFNDAQAFKKSFIEYDYQILRSAAEYNHFDIVNRLLEMYPQDLPDVFKKRGEDIIRKAIEFDHAELIEHYLKIYPEGRKQAFLNALLMNKDDILKQFKPEEIDEWIKTDGDNVFRNAYLSGNVMLFDKLLDSFSPEKKAQLINEYAFDAFYRSVGSNHLDMLVRIDSLLDTDELRARILHQYSRKDLLESAIRIGNIQECDWVRAIKIKEDDVFLGMNCLGGALSNHDVAKVDFLIEYAESYGVLKDFLSAWGYQSLQMATHYGDLDIFEHIVTKVEPEEFVNFIKNGIWGSIFYDALAKGHEEVADRIEHYAKQYDCWEDVKEQNILADIKELMRQSPHVIQRFLETTNHLEKIDYREITSFLSDKWQAFNINPSFFLTNHPQQIDAVIQYAIKTHQAFPSNVLQVLDLGKYEKAWIDAALRVDNEDFILTYLNLPEMFDKVYGDKGSQLKNYLMKAQPDECLSAQDRMKIANTLQQALQKMRMDYGIRLEDSPIPSLKLSMHFQNAYEMELFKTHLGVSAPESVQFPCEQTIDIYRKHGQVDIQQLSENLNRIQTQLGFGNSDPGYLVVGGISATMDSFENPDISAYTKTTVKGEDYFCLSIKNPSNITEYQKTLLDNLVTLFPLMCEKNGIEKIKGDWISKRTHLESNTDYYEFNISADDFHELMLKESDYYRGYRNSIYSVYQLTHPETQYYKPDTMCLFPIQPLENEMMIRNAGCNVSEVLSVQLSALIQQLFVEYKTTSIGGHHQSKILEKFGIGSNELVTAALMCAGASPVYIARYSYHEAFDGLNTIPLTEEHKQNIQEMDTTTLPIYGVSANLKSELSALKSFEVPMETFLSTLKTVCQDKPQVVENLQELIEKMQSSNVSKLSR